MEKEILNIYNTLISKYKFDDEIKSKVKYIILLYAKINIK